MLARLFVTHRTWEDWFGMALGVLIGLSPWLADYGLADYGLADHAVGRAAAWNAVLVGLLVFLVAELEYVVLRRWEESCQLLLGLWLVISPYMFGYFEAGALRFWHSTLGGLLILLAALELWQDWTRSDKDMLDNSRLFGG